MPDAPYEFEVVQSGSFKTVKRMLLVAKISLNCSRLDTWAMLIVRKTSSLSFLYFSQSRFTSGSSFAQASQVKLQTLMKIGRPLKALRDTAWPLTSGRVTSGATSPIFIPTGTKVEDGWGATCVEDGDGLTVGDELHPVSDIANRAMIPNLIICCRKRISD